MVPVSARLQRILIIKHVLFPKSMLENDLEPQSCFCVCFECIFSSHTNIGVGGCILGDCAICSEKFYIVVQRNRAFGTMCLVNWDTNAGGIVVF